MLVLVAAGLLVTMPIGASVLGTSGSGAPTIGSDRPDYAPGSTVTLTGSNWDPDGSAVHIVVNDDAGQTWTHSADPTPAGDGSVQDVFTLPDWFVATYSVTATQTTSSGGTLSATTSFADFNSDFKQCANDSTAGDGVCAWIGGALNSGKSNYAEGMSIPQRLILADIPVVGDHLHVLTFHIDATKGGKHSFDWLTSWQQALDLAAAEGATFTDLNDCGPAIQGSLAGLCTTLDGQAIPGPNTATPDVPDDTYVSHDGATLPKIQSFETEYSNRTISIQANAPISNVTLTQTHNVPAAGDTGDSKIDVVLQWSGDASAVLVKFGAHLSLGPNFGNVAGWGVGKGASSVSGGPYHVSLDQLANGANDQHPISLGSQDNNVQVGAIPALPQLIVIKHVINDNGGTKTASDFTMNVTGTSPTPSQFPGAEAPGTTVTLGAGSYSVEESSTLGYTETKSADCSGSITFGQTKTCTITNDDQPATLIVKKLVINDNGGSKIATDFAFKVNGGTATSFIQDGADPLKGKNTLTKNAGTYNVVEDSTPIAGYTTTYDNCSNIQLAAGETKTCTITNDDQPATLIVKKLVINDNGGSKIATDFAFKVNGGTATSFIQDADTLHGKNTLSVGAGTYSVVEDGTPIAGYTTTYDNCSNVVVANGGTQTCTITNDDQQATITVVKVVNNNHGGTAQPDDFKLTLAGNATTSGTPVNVNPGTYKADETLLSGYTFDGYTGACGSDGKTTVALGEHKTCTLTNSDIAPTLHLRKVVVNDSGGTAKVADFTLSANGTGSNDLSGTSPVDSGSGFKADTWALSETNVSGYSASAWVCVGGTQSGSNITLGIGDEATCTITNDDQPGKIIITKLIKPTGSSTSFNFTTNPEPPYSHFSLAGGQSNTQTLAAGAYSVTEIVPLGWVLTGIGGSSDPNTPYNCTVKTDPQNGFSGPGTSSGVGNLNTQKADITLKNGDIVTCVFENTGQGVTRTQGFWATHSPLANIAWFGGDAFGHHFDGVAAVNGIGDRTLCTPVTKDIDTLGKIMGGFWSDVSKTTTGVKRSSLDQARMQLLQQLLAAELNASAFGSVPGSGTFAAWEAAYCGTNVNAIKTAQQQAASFNTAGDSSSFTPGTSADSKNARSIANTVFWNVLP